MNYVKITDNIFNLDIYTWKFWNGWKEVTQFSVFWFQFQFCSFFGVVAIVFYFKIIWLRFQFRFLGVVVAFKFDFGFSLTTLNLPRWHPFSPTPSPLISLIELTVFSVASSIFHLSQDIMILVSRSLHPAVNNTIPNILKPLTLSRKTRGAVLNERASFRPPHKYTLQAL